MRHTPPLALVLGSGESDHFGLACQNGSQGRQPFSHTPPPKWQTIGRHPSEIVPDLARRQAKRIVYCAPRTRSRVVRQPTSGTEPTQPVGPVLGALHTPSVHRTPNAPTPDSTLLVYNVMMKSGRSHLPGGIGGMMKFDLHMHTARHSPDSSIDPFALVRRAREIGLDGVV